VSQPYTVAKTMEDFVLMELYDIFQSLNSCFSIKNQFKRFFYMFVL